MPNDKKKMPAPPVLFSPMLLAPFPNSMGGKHFFIPEYNKSPCFQVF